MLSPCWFWSDHLGNRKRLCPTPWTTASHSPTLSWGSPSSRIQQTPLDKDLQSTPIICFSLDRPGQPHQNWLACEWVGGWGPGRKARGVARQQAVGSPLPMSLASKKKSGAEGAVPKAFLLFPLQLHPDRLVPCFLRHHLCVREGHPDGPGHHPEGHGHLHAAQCPLQLPHHRGAPALVW